MNTRIVALAIPLLVIGTPALADTDQVPLSVTVGYADLDLTSQQGVKRLDRRLDQAIDQVCGDPRALLAMSERISIHACARDTLADVTPQRQAAIDRANGRAPTVEVAMAGQRMRIAARRN